MFRWLTALLLMLPLAAFGLENTNSISVTPGASSGHDWDQFDIDISGFDDQMFRFTIGAPWPASHTWTFKMARHSITGQVAYVTVPNASITADPTPPLVYFQLDRTNIPPDGVYLSSLRADDGTLGTDIARGKINVTQSIFDDNDGTFTFPAAVAAVDYFKRSGDILIPTDTEPTGSEGYIYWDDSEATIKAHDGTGWKAVGLAGATDHGALTGRGDDDHSAYGSLAGAETIAGNWVNTANPWADNEVANDLTVDESGIAAAITRDAEWDTFAELQTAVSDKTLINEEDAARFDVMLSVGSGSGDSTSGPGDLYVQDIIEADGGANIAGTLTVGTIEEFATDGGVTVNDALIFPQQHVDLTEESSPVTLTAAQSKFGFITVDDAMTINLASPVVGMTFTILVLDDVVVTIDGNGSNVWMDGTTDSSDPETIVNSGSAGECISLFWDGDAWRAHHVEGSWTVTT